MKIVKILAGHNGHLLEHYLVNDAVRFYPEQHRAWIIEGGISVEDYSQLQPYFTAQELTMLQLKFGPLVNPTKALYELFKKVIDADNK